MLSSGVTDAFSSALTAIQGDATGMITSALPFALGIAGVVLTIRLGWKAFKSFTGR